MRTYLMSRIMREASLKGGVILFCGSGTAARRYVETDRSRADEYYLGADGVSAWLVAHQYSATNPTSS